MTIRSLRLIVVQMAGFALAICIAVPVQAQQDNQAMVDMVIQIQQLQDEVRTLRGMLEDQSAELENLNNRQRDQFLDLDQRINDFRNTNRGPVVSAPTQAGVTTAAATMDRQQGTTKPTDRPAVRKSVGTQSSVTALATPDTQARDMAASPENEKAAYDRAFGSLKELNYADAAEQFQSFLQQYPNSEFADNAQYWLGESYYVTRNYDIALEAFQKLLGNYPESPKVADGLLKIGYTHYELKQWDQARAALEQVQQQYPNTTLARLADSRLRSMKLEGHY